MWAIILKDWRENLVTYLVFLGSTVLLTGIMVKLLAAEQEGSYFFILFALVFSCFVAMVASNLVAGEKSRRTLTYLLSLPRNRLVIWTAVGLLGVGISIARA